jgi:hypothetical protein
MKRPLRIFLCCQQDLGHAHAVPAYRFWADYFRAALAEAGHVCLEAPECDWAAGLLARSPEEHRAWLETTWARAVDWSQREQARAPIDLFLSYLFPAQILPSAVATMRAAGIPCVNFFCDNVRLFRRVPEAFHGFDLHWVPESAALPMYAKAGLPVLHAAMACWVPPSLRDLPRAETLPPTFVGTRDEVRELLFAEAFTHGLKAELRGCGWERAAPAATVVSHGGKLQNQIAFARQHGPMALARKVRDKLLPPTPLTFDFSPFVRPMPASSDYARVLRESAVCLGVNRFPSLRHSRHRPPTYSRLRDLEAPMCGACYLTEWAPGLDTMYDLGREIETYRDAAELVAKVQALVADAPRRASLRLSGQRRALADHTIPRTLERIANQLGLSR